MSLGLIEREGFGAMRVGPAGYCDDLLQTHEDEVRPTHPPTHPPTHSLMRVGPAGYCDDLQTHEDEVKTPPTHPPTHPRSPLLTHPSIYLLNPPTHPPNHPPTLSLYRSNVSPSASKCCVLSSS